MSVTLVPCTVAVATAVLAGDHTVVAAAEGWPHADTYDALRPYAEHGRDDVPGPYLIVLDGEVIGECGWYAPPGPDGEIEIGYGLAAPFRGQGHGTAAVRQLVAWACAQPDVRRVVAGVDAGNTASRRLLERVGFVIEETDGVTVRYVLA